MMDADSLEMVLRLEQKIDQLLDRYQNQVREMKALREENAALRKEREGVCSELDRILDKLDGLDGEMP